MSSPIPTSRRAAVAVAAAAFVSLVPLAGPAEAASAVTCGSTLTRSTTLTKDLRCTGDGVVLGPGVTLDLAGHQLVGNGTGAGSGTAVTIAPGVHTAAVRNGTIRNWATGVRSFEGVDLTPLDLTLAKVRMSGAKLDLEVTNLVLADSALYSSPIRSWVGLIDVRRSTLKGSDTTGEMSETRAVDSTIIAGGLGQDENHRVRAINTRFDGTGYAGSALGCGGALYLSGGVVQDYGQRIGSSRECPLTVNGTTFRNHPLGAIFSEYADGEIVTRVTGASFTNSGMAIVGGSLAVTGSSFSRNEIGVNRDLPGGGQGVDRSTVTRSVFTDNTDSGIYTTDPDLALGRNTAIGNGTYGIYAPGAVDRGHNVARDNGTADCVGVVCRAD